MPAATLSRACRTATAADAAAILACQRAALSALATGGSYADTRLAQWAADLTEEDHLPGIARQEFEVVEESAGIIAFSEFDAADGHIPSLFVHPDFVRQGHGTLLLWNIARQAERLGLSSLTVYASLPAAGFYEKFGFTALPERIMHFDGGISLPYIPMHRALRRRAGVLGDF